MFPLTWRYFFKIILLQSWIRAQYIIMHQSILMATKQTRHLIATLLQCCHLVFTKWQHCSNAAIRCLVCWVRVLSGQRKSGKQTILNVHQRFCRISGTCFQHSFCSGQGLCNQDTSTCDCSLGWSGDDCTTPQSTGKLVYHE